ncbi:Oidioi.mRNA.OKI2018_I69.XSR.g14532.t1.cds [Oikopleura dioica]|uniref:Oidioi.mRNA.OKI2018_I69.XSR.g14532.t1.cds n=1 Tax=Oikopleura dioica TaxID=34765 RepID=A0ABN7SJ05_OIKDI|nr:Oidioi.mRNA.OKI2018_I69.XSR.g14532.t1.cds [Oikopleura dioica]
MDEVLDFVREERKNRQGVLDAIRTHPERHELAKVIMSRLDAGDLLQLSGLLAPRNKAPPYDNILNTLTCQELLRSLTKSDLQGSRGNICDSDLPAPNDIAKWWHIYLRREEKQPNLSGIIHILQNAAPVKEEYSIYEDFVIVNRIRRYPETLSKSIFDRKEIQIKTTPFTKPMKNHGVLVLRRMKMELTDPSKPLPQLMAKRAEFNCLMSLKNYESYVDTFEEIKEYEDMVEKKYAERPGDTSSDKMGKNFWKTDALRDIRNKKWINECQGCKYYGECECYKLKKLKIENKSN